MRTSLFAFVFYCALLVGVRATEVTVEGKAAGDSPNAREEALTDGLREAVRVGAGVDLLSTTSVKDFSLEFDRVLSASFGYVKNYHVISSAMGKDGIYRLQVRADVDKGTPGMNELLALKQIVLLKQSPRVALDIKEDVDGITSPSTFGVSWFEQAAEKMQLQLVDVGAVADSENKRAARDELLGDTNSAKFRQADISQKADFIIQGKITGRYAGQESIYGSAPQHDFEMGAELRAIRPDTGEIVASVIIPSTDKYDSDLQTKEMAAREIINKVLNGKGTAEAPGAWAVFNKIFARWMTEIDCGTVKRLEFSDISSEDFQKVQSDLRNADKVSAVWQREFDSKAKSIVDIETRLTAAEVQPIITKSIGEKVELDRSTENYLQYRPTTTSVQTEKSSEKKGKGFFDWIFR